jgi:hypothetical protein
MVNDNWSEVRSNGSVMRYRRWGGKTGSPAVLLLGRFGAIVPELPEPGTDILAWLGAFIEGLGTGGLTVLATGPYYDAALELAAHDPDRIARVSPLANG